jgi:hypothetical protein
MAEKDTEHLLTPWVSPPSHYHTEKVNMIWTCPTFCDFADVTINTLVFGSLPSELKICEVHSRWYTWLLPPLWPCGVVVCPVNTP